MPPAFPESPVTGSDVLAYSCAAARDLHPLPILARADKDTRIVNVEKELANEEQTIAGGGEEVKSVTSSGPGYNIRSRDRSMHDKPDTSHRSR